MFTFALLCGASKVFMKALKVFLKSFEKPQRCAEIKISRFSASLIREFGAKNYFTDHRTDDTVLSFVPTKRTLFGSILVAVAQQPEATCPQRLLDKYSPFFISMSLKQTLNSRQKPVATCQNPNIKNTQTLLQCFTMDKILFSAG